MADAVGITHAMHRVAQQQAAQAAQLSSPNAAVQQALVGVPGLARVPLPPRGPEDQFVKPKKAAAPMGVPRRQDGGSSPLSTASVSDTAGGASLIGEQPDAPVEERAHRQGAASSEQLPGRNGLVAYARTQRGEYVYLEQDRWHEHIRPDHITNPPVARGKRTTTWWPVQHAATGTSSMSENDVVGVIMSAVRDGHWQNAMKGTRLATYELPAQDADRFGVSEVKVSAAPDGRILSAYPARGSNVLAVRELSAEEQAAVDATTAAPAQQPQHSEEDTRLFRTNIANTTFG